MTNKINAQKSSIKSEIAFFETKKSGAIADPARNILQLSEIFTLVLFSFPSVESQARKTTTKEKSGGGLTS